MCCGSQHVAAWLFAMLNSGDHSDVLEGIIITVAAGLMLYVKGWLLVKQDPRRWQNYLAHKAESALAQDTVWAVAALAFLAVFRDGDETVLFINALASLSNLSAKPCRISEVPVTELKSTGWVSAMGLNPTLEALSAQLLVMLFALATYSVVQRFRATTMHSAKS
jgi:high-affinity iron transporter